MKQFDKDFSRFLQVRSEEIVTGGHMVLTFVGRSITDPYEGHFALLDLLSKSLIDLIHEVHYFTSANILLSCNNSLRVFNFSILIMHKQNFALSSHLEGNKLL